jgi:integrase/recombinase XerD
MQSLATIQTNTVQRLSQLNNGATDNYISQTKTFINWLRNNDRDVTEESIRDYFTWLNESGYKAQTVAIKRQAVKKRIRELFKHAPIEDRMKIDQVLHELDHETKTKSPQINSKQITRDMVLDHGEYMQLLECCRSEKQRLFIEYLYCTGCRVSELTGAELRNCTFHDKTVKIRIMGKGSKERFIRISIELHQRIIEEFKGERFLFETASHKAYDRCYISRQIKVLGKRIGKEISAHTLRHSWATKMVGLYPGKISAISKYLGHSSPSITMSLYVHQELTDDELFFDLTA